jgi:epoxyqueuosine reductase
MGNRIFGCDICQEVCPWNGRFAEPSREQAYAAGPDTDGPRLVELLTLTQEEFSSRFSGSPIKRAKRSGFLRNVAVALGNWMGSADATPEEALEALCAALEDEEPLVRGHAAWALGQVPSAETQRALGARLPKETDGFVREEIEMALGSATPRNHDT